MTNCDQKSNLHENENTLLTVSLRKFLQVLIAEKVHQTYSMEFIPQNVTDETHTHWEHLFVYCYTQAFILHMILCSLSFVFSTNMSVCQSPSVIRKWGEMFLHLSRKVGLHIPHTIQNLTSLLKKFISRIHVLHVNY